jgi:hypothetical protein
MVLGDRDRERFWIALTVRVAFGMMFLIAAVNIFFADPGAKVFENLDSFVNTLSKPFETSWVNAKFHSWGIDPQTGAPSREYQVGMPIIQGFLYAMPFIFSVLSILLLTGLFLRPALRASAIFLVLLGLGKYLTDFRSGNTVTTMQDFLYAMFITFALFVLSREKPVEPGPL